MSCVTDTGHLYINFIRYKKIEGTRMFILGNLRYYYSQTHKMDYALFVNIIWKYFFHKIITISALDK